MHNEFVPYDAAVELRDLGMSEACMAFWSKGVHELAVPAPTFSQAFRWFREKHDLDGFVQGRGYERKKYYINTINGTWNPLEHTFNSPEEAELACLKKLIELVKNK